MSTEARDRKAAASAIALVSQNRHARIRSRQMFLDAKGSGRGTGLGQGQGQGQGLGGSARRSSFVACHPASEVGSASDSSGSRLSASGTTPAPRRQAPPRAASASPIRKNASIKTVARALGAHHKATIAAVSSSIPSAHSKPQASSGAGPGRRMAATGRAEQASQPIDRNSSAKTRSAWNTRRRCERRMRHHDWIKGRMTRWRQGQGWGGGGRGTGGDRLCGVGHELWRELGAFYLFAFCLPACSLSALFCSSIVYVGQRPENIPPHCSKLVDRPISAYGGKPVKFCHTTRDVLENGSRRPTNITVDSCISENSGLTEFDAARGPCTQ